MQGSFLERACPLIFFLKLIAPYNFDAWICLKNEWGKPDIFFGSEVIS